MSTAPRGGILYRYVPGTGRVAAIDCGGGGFTPSYITAFGTTDETLTAGTAANIIHDTVPFSAGITLTPGASGGFIVQNTGVYTIVPSVQVLSGGNGNITIWLKVNGVNIANSATLTLAKNGEEGIITCEYMLQLNANDFVQVWGIAQSANMTINYIPAGGSGANAYPAAPAIITNMHRIA
jgi:hypothetical protein